MLDEEYSDDTTNDYFAEGMVESDKDKSEACANKYPVADKTVLVFEKHMMNLKALTYYSFTSFPYGKFLHLC